MPANMTSVRLQILKNIVAGFMAMQADQPGGDPYGVAFSTVELGPLAKFDQRKKFSLGVHMGQEKETFKFPFIMCFMVVNIEFRATINRDDDDPGVVIEEVLSVVKRFVGNNRSWGGIAIDTKVIRSEIDLVTYADRSALGVCVCEVQYRYNTNDPRSQTGS
jgi:hypothetical protein